MAGETLYFATSILLVLGLAFFVVSLLVAKKTGRVLLGPVYAPGSPEHKRLVGLARRRNLVVCVLLEATLILNLAYAVRRILQLNDPLYARLLLIYVPIFIAVVSVPVMYRIRKLFSSMNKHK